jgi:hypothetical protein
MAIDLYDPDQRCEPREAGGRAPPRCHTRPAMPEAAASRLDADGDATVLAFGIALIAICVASFLILRNGWSF